MDYYKRTDLACERTGKEKEKYSVFTEAINGIDCIASIYKDGEKTESITVCVGKIWQYSDEYFERAANTVSICVDRLINESVPNADNILIVCLGNKGITADSLGPLTGDKLIPTRHLASFRRRIGVLITGVEGQSGFTSTELVQSSIKIWEPDMIIVIDSLCAGNSQRILTTVQISSKGIMPGSGAGRHKGEISLSTVGKPIISIGVPTVCEYLQQENKKTIEGVSDFYISRLEIDEGIEAFSSLISSSVKKLYY